MEEVKFESRDRFRIQAERFSQCILDGMPSPISLEDSLNNIKALRSLNDSAYV